VTFLLENHVMQAEDAITPIKQLYFVIQMMLMSPNNSSGAMELCGKMLSSLQSAVRDRRICDGLVKVGKNIDDRRLFDALKQARSLFPIEQEILASELLNPTSRVA